MKIKKKEWRGQSNNSNMLSYLFSYEKCLYDLLTII